MQWKIINEVLNCKRDVCVVMATGTMNFKNKLRMYRFFNTVINKLYLNKG